MQHFVVTGSGGYIGRHIVRVLRARGHKVTAVARNRPDIARDPDTTYYDVLNSSPDVFAELGKPDVCIHAAWENGFNHGHDCHLENLPKHVSFLQNMLRGGLKHIASIGTVHEIGFHVGPVSETTPTNPTNPYGIAKTHLQRVQKLLCDKHGAVDQWLRCYYIVGDDKLSNSIFGKIIAAVERGQADFPLNTGEMLYDFVDVGVLGELIADVASQDAVRGIINCCSGEPVTLKTKVLEFIASNKFPINPKWGEFPTRPYDSRAVWGDTQKLILARAAANNTRRA